MSRCLPRKQLSWPPVFSSRLLLSSNDTKGGVWTPEVRRLHPRVVCTALLYCSLKKKSQWLRHRRDNPAMSQIFIGTEPLMGASNEIWTQRRPRFNQRKEFGEKGGRGFAAGGCSHARGMLLRKLLWAKRCFLFPSLTIPLLVWLPNHTSAALVLQL